MSIGLLRYWCVGFVLGLVSGGLPLIVAQLKGPAVDPFDYGISYLVWGGSAFIVTSLLAYVLPRRQVLSAFSVLIGFLAAMVLEIIIDYHTGRAPHNLWPLTLTFALLISAPPVFVGAYVGSRLRV